MAYVLGFIYADGCIRPNQSKGAVRHYPNRLRIEIEDHALLEDIRKVMGSNHPIKGRFKISDINNILGYYSYLCITRRELVNDLMTYGLIPKKSKVMQFPNVPVKYLSHFIRGHFDGDGHVSELKSGGLAINFSSSSSDFL